MATGKALRTQVPRSAHAAYVPSPNRRDPIDVLVESNQGRIHELIPIRYGRMLQSPLAFFRGAAAVMAADLATTPATGVRVQCCGDCHLLNFGAFATPERNVIFDINDFDETLPGPWEWDVKRLAASFVVACRNNGLKPGVGREAATIIGRSYRERLAEFAQMRALDVWYTRLNLATLIERTPNVELRNFRSKQIKKELDRAAAERDFPKLAEKVGDTVRIKDDPPLIYHIREHDAAPLEHHVRHGFSRYRETLQEDRRMLFDRYELADFAVKVVGVGSVGTFCAVALFAAAADDLLVLQIKQARPSVLEPYVGNSALDHHGHRVVTGQRKLQSASDIFLGWANSDLGQHFYVRQLRDAKIKPLVEAFDETAMLEYADVCGWSLARAHARAGDAATISGYLGNRDVFDEALADFAVAYADQTERDHAALAAAARSGRIEVVTEH